MPIRRQRRRWIEVVSPGIPTATVVAGIPDLGNHWFPTRDEARRAALAAARRLGLGSTIVADVRVGPGQHPHYHVLTPGRRRAPGHFFFGGRPPRKALERRWGQGRYEYEAAREADYFVVRTFVTPEGHERLTRDAASGLPGLLSADLSALIEGVRRVDTGSLPDHFRADQQKRHVLRREVCQPLAAALSEARNHLARLHGLALGSGLRRDAFRWFGEALHLIQDSYSEAHVQRERGGRVGGPHPIVFIRYFGLRGRRHPIEHRVFPAPDPRDLILDASGALKPWAAISVRASREYLRLALRHLASPRSPRRAAELRAFMDRHLVLSPRRTEPSRYYPRCP